MRRRLLEIWDGWPAKLRFAVGFAAVVVVIAVIMTAIDLTASRDHTNDPSPALPAAGTGSAR